jgi:tetratricopeptide (TPR) repeat protein
MTRVLLLAGVIACAAGAPGLAAVQAGPGAQSLQERLARVGADVLSGKGSMADAIAELKAILAIDPRLADAHLLLGIAYRSAGSPELTGEATAELLQALALDPGSVPARYYLARLYIDLGRAKRAREELEKALAQMPGQPQFLALLGEAERQLGNPARSLELNRQVLQGDESFAEARYYLGLAMYDLGRRDEAVQEFERVVRSGVQRPEVLLSLGTAYVQAGRLDAAIETLTTATSLAPSRADIRIELAHAYRSKRQLDKADEQLKLAEPGAAPALASPADQQIESDFYLEQGLVRLQAHQLAAARKSLLKVLDIDPNHGPANRALAEVYLAQGLYTRAREHAARAEKAGFPLPDEKRKLLAERAGAKSKGRQ